MSKTPPRSDSTFRTSIPSSTPYNAGKVSMSGSQTRKRSSIDHLLQTELEGRKQVIAVDRFLQHFLQCPQDRIDMIRAHVPRLKVELDAQLRLYESAVKETDLYGPYVAIANALLDEAATITTEPLKTPMRFLDSSRVSIPGVNKRFPDVFAVATDDDEPTRKPTWPLLTVIHEFKFTKTAKEKGNRAAAVGTPLEHSSCSDVKRSEPSSSSRKRRATFEELSSNPKRTKTSAITQPSSKTSSNVTKPGLQLASYILEAMSCIGHRQSAFGFLIDRSKIQLWYFDREGPVCTADFDLREDFEIFATAILSFVLCDHTTLGLLPILRVPSGKWPSSLIGCLIELRDGTKFKLGQMLYSQYGLIGRGTVVYEADPCGADGSTPQVSGEPADHVVKWSWQVCTRVSEYKILQLAYEIDSKHVPKPLYACDNHKISEGPRSLAEAPSEEDRVLRVLQLPRLYHIYELGDLELFKKVWREIFECHHKLYESGILHRDVSSQNLMFAWREEEPVGVLNDFDLAVVLPGTDPETGFPTQHTPSSKHRTGTRPFMAIDLLDNGNKDHLYRFDLESFFYVLIWICARYSEGKDINPSALQEWSRGTNKDISDGKWSVLTKSTEWERIKFTTQFQTLKRSWAGQLWKSFRTGYLALQSLQASTAVDVAPEEVAEIEEAQAAFDDETLDGAVSYEKLSQIFSK